MIINGQTVTLDENLMLSIRIKKAALALRNKATINVGGLTQQLREQLLTNFTAYSQRQRTMGELADSYIPVTIQAGYSIGGVATLTQVYKGQIVSCGLVSPPPNVILQIVCYTQQQDTVNFITTQAPSGITYAAYAAWAANQMGLSLYIDTAYANTIIYNPGRTCFTVSALLLDLQRYDRITIAAYIDDDQLIVKDKNKIINPANILTISEFLGMPTWNEWGINFTVLFNNAIKLAGGVNLMSILNPSINNTNFVIIELDYNLESRDKQFSITANVCPSA
jgi:hypothetical protein